jgi:MFS family permease
LKAESGGILGGLLIVATIALASSLWPRSLPDRAFALINGAYSVGTLVGPVAGGVGLAVTSTRVVYAVAGAVVAVGGLLFLAVEAAARSPLRPALLPGESMKE